MTAFRPRKEKLQAYVKAVRMMNQGKSQYEACRTHKISRMTFNKYRDFLGEEIAENQFAVPVIEAKPKVIETPQEKPTELELLLKENAALAEQLELRKELAKYVH